MKVMNTAFRVGSSCTISKVLVAMDPRSVSPAGTATKALGRVTDNMTTYQRKFRQSGKTTRSQYLKHIDVGGA